MDGVSQIQRLQMATQQGSNVAVQAVEGNFDDCQTGVKHLFAKEQLAERLGEQKMYPVSYTHLDVYKRQHLGHSRRPYPLQFRPPSGEEVLVQVGADAEIGIVVHQFQGAVPGRIKARCV